MGEGTKGGQRRETHHLELGEDKGHVVRTVSARVEEDHNLLPRVDHAPEGGPVALLHRERGRDIREVRYP
jgi:hypothetical protein